MASIIYHTLLHCKIISPSLRIVAFSTGCMLTCCEWIGIGGVYICKLQYWYSTTLNFCIQRVAWKYKVADYWNVAGRAVLLQYRGNVNHTVIGRLVRKHVDSGHIKYRNRPRRPPPRTTPRNGYALVPLARGNPMNSACGCNGKYHQEEAPDCGCRRPLITVRHRQ